MANKHYGNFADVFKHVALAEFLAVAQPAEYWESHAGSAGYDESAPAPAERLHGIHTFLQLTHTHDILKLTRYHRVLNKCLTNGTLAHVPGSPRIARELLGTAPRRYLFCDTDDHTLNSVQKLGADCANFDCVQDDGLTVLRGATLLLPEHWASSVFALLDPYDPDALTAADISAFDLWAEMASRGIMAVLWYPFADQSQRLARHTRINALIARYHPKSTHRFEAFLNAPATPAPPTLWGHGLLAANLPTPALDAADKALRTLQAAYAHSTLGAGMPGAFTYQHTTL